MPVWLMPALKAIAPHIGTIISAAMPVFTKKSADAAANQTALLQQQIAELQEAAAVNATYIRELAAQIQKTVGALEIGAAEVEVRMQRTVMFCVVAFGLSVVALVLAIAAMTASGR